MIVPVGKCKGSKDVRHVECGGQLAIEGWATQRLPTGMGFLPGDAKFSVACVTVKYFKGFCMKCRAEGYFRRADSKPRASVVHPKKINRKIEAARAAMGGGA